MTYSQVIKHFKTAQDVARDLDYTTQAVYLWKTRGAIPLRAQRAIETFTKGTLKADKRG